MNRPELCARIAARTSLSRAAAAGALAVVTSAIDDALASGEAVDIEGFGKFTIRERAARRTEHPRTGEALAMAPSRAPAFQAARLLRDKVNT